MAGTVQRDWTWDLTVLNDGSEEQDVKVVVWDFDSTTFAFTPVLTNVNGQIAQQELRENIWSVTGTTETPDPQTPHTFSLVKYGNQPLGGQINFVSSRIDTLRTVTNDFITESVKATVAAYTGVTINHTTETITLDGTGVTPVNTFARLYDYCQNEAFDDPQKDFPGGIMATTDGSTFTLEYDLVINGFVFNGQSKTVNMATGKTVTFGTTGRADDMAVGGSANWGTSTTLDNFDVTGTLTFTESVTVAATDTQIGTVDTEGTPTQETVVINIINDQEVSSIGTNADPTNITINNAVSLSFKVIDSTDGSDVQNARIFLEAAAGGPLGAGTDIIPGDALTDVNGEHSESFNFTSNQPVVGRIRRTSPGFGTLYKTFDIVGTITGAGLTVNASLIRDE